MAVLITDDILQSARMTDDEMRLEIATLLFQKEKLTLGQAARLAGMDLLRFQRLLAGRGIAVHYGIEEFDEDMKTIEGLPR